MSFFDRIKKAFSRKTGVSTKTNSGSKIRVSKPKGGRGSYQLQQKPKNSAFSDLKMDLGITPRNDVYYRDLADRNAASQKALADMKARRAKKNDRKNAITATDTTTDTDTTTTTTTTDPDITNVGTSATSTVTPPPDPGPPVVLTDTFDSSGNQTSGINTAASGVIEAEQIRAAADGPSEAAVGETATKGRRATIQTTPQGLLGTPAKTRRRRSLMGGGLLQ
jgi:hypothetical protein